MRRETVIGILFLMIAGFFLYFGSALPMGTAARMGAGYVPVVGAGILAILGVAILGMDLWQRSGSRLPRPNWFGLGMIFAGILTFSLVLKPAGLVIATILLVMIAALAERRFRPLESFALGAFLALAAGLIFVKGIGLQLPLWPTL